MSSNNLLGFLLVPIIQAILLFAAARNAAGSSGTTTPLALLALVVPLACYVWAFHDAPLGRTTIHPVLRFAILGLGSICLSLAGFVIGLMFLAGRSN